MENPASIVKRPLLSWIWSRHLKLQVLLITIAVIAVIARVVPLEMQKRIVNEAVDRASADLLMIYCSIYFLAFITASGLKYFINTLQTMIAQRTLADMRMNLFGHMIRLPMAFFRDTESGLVVSALVTELATAGDFIGMAVAVPMTNLLTLAAFAAYLFWLNPLLALVSFSIYPLVLMLIPRLQRRVNQYNRKRVDATRRMSSKIGEIVDGIHEVKGNGAYSIEDGKFKKLTRTLRDIRIKWNLYRFGVKVTNNLFTNLSRFMIFALGGYLALKGRLELGALVAFLSAQEKLYDPWKELIRFYQAYQTAAVTYDRTRHYFNIPAETSRSPANRPPMELEGRLEVDGLSFVTDTEKTLLQNISFSLDHGQHLALVGFSGSGKSTLANCLSGLYRPSSGSLKFGGKDISELTLRDLSHNIGFVSQRPFVFNGTIEENLTYATDADAADGRPGRSPRDAQPDLNDHIEALQLSGLFIDVLNIGLLSKPTPGQPVTERLRSGVLGLRKEFRDKFTERLADDIESYHPDRFIYHASLAENLLFGMPRRNLSAAQWLLDHLAFEAVLEDRELRRWLLDLGVRISEHYLDIFGPRKTIPRHLPVSTDELRTYRKPIERYHRKGLDALTSKARRHFMKLALDFSPSNQPIASVCDPAVEGVLAARRRLADQLTKADRQQITRYDRNRFIDGASILENIIFGKLKGSSAESRDRIVKHINQLLVEQALLESILKIGLQFEVGSGGENLSGGQKQKLAIARALLKKPPLFIMDEATASLDNKSQARVQNMLETRWKERSSLVAVIHRLDIIKNYDRIAVMKAGRIEEFGSYAELMAKKGVLFRLVAGKP